jgi:hypothetical protein
MQICLTAMRGRKVHELAKWGNSNIFVSNIVTQLPYNIRNGMLYRWKDR